MKRPTLLLMLASLVSACSGTPDESTGSTPPAASPSDTSSDIDPSSAADSCTAAINRVESLYASARQCNTDSDCAYISGVSGSGAYNIEESADGQYTVWRDCATGREGFIPIVVANPTLVEQNLQRISVAVEDQQRACNQDGTVRCQAFVPILFSESARCSTRGICESRGRTE